MLCTSRAKKAHTWRTTITSFIVFVLVSLFAVARDGFFMSKTADPRIVADCLGVLGPVHDRLTRLNDDLEFSPIVHNSEFDCC